MNDYQIMIAMINGEVLKDPRTILYEWLLEKAEPFFTYLKENFGIAQGTVIAVLVHPLMIVMFVDEIRKDKKSIKSILLIIIYAMGICSIVAVIVLAQKYK